MTYPWDNPEEFQTVEDAFLEVMATAVRIYRRTTTDAYNQETYEEEPIIIPVYLEGADEDFTTSNGNSVHTTGIAYFGFVVPWLTVDDRLDVPDTAEPSGWRRTSIGGIKELYGPDGLHHQEVYYGPMGAAGQGIGSG